MTSFTFSKHFFTVIFITLAPVFFSYANAFDPKIVLIIDDLGYRKTDENALKLPGNITYAVLPHTPYGKTLAVQAHKNNHDVLLHIPMESTIGKKLGPGGLTSDMLETDFIETLEAAFEEIPFVIGINNHMGSKLTQLYTRMEWTMRVLKNKNMMFLDSMTTRLSQGIKAAEHYNIPHLERHVFLDNILTEEYISQQFSQLIRIAKANAKVNKVAVGIAHPHPETIEILTKLLPSLTNENVSLVKISSLLKPMINEKLIVNTLN